MTVTSKNRIKEALEQAKQEGQLRAEKIKEIARNAVSETKWELTEGRQQINTLIRDAVAAVVELFQDKSGDFKEEITASLEGTIEGIRKARGQAISQERTDLKQLQSKLDRSEAEFQQEIDSALVQIEDTQTERSEKVKVAIADAIYTIKNSEEVALLQKRYAQLKAQLAIVEANLADRYGDRYEDVKHYLDEAKTWYERAKENPEVFTERVESRRVEFENQLSNAGTSVARGEQQMKLILQQLWHSITELFHERKAEAKRDRDLDR
ncbi:MAG: histidine kinase [Xenococcaceae cyanobacterium]